VIDFRKGFAPFYVHCILVIHSTKKDRKSSVDSLLAFLSSNMTALCAVSFKRWEKFHEMGAFKLLSYLLHCIPRVIVSESGGKWLLFFYTLGNFNQSFRLFFLNHNVIYFLHTFLRVFFILLSHTCLIFKCMHTYFLIFFTNKKLYFDEI
jgi:hypothetical protein